MLDLIEKINAAAESLTPVPTPAPRDVKFPVTVDGVEIDVSIDAHFVTFRKYIENTATGNASVSCIFYRPDVTDAERYSAGAQQVADIVNAYRSLSSAMKLLTEAPPETGAHFGPGVCPECKGGKVDPLEPLNPCPAC